MKITIVINTNIDNNSNGADNLKVSYHLKGARPRTSLFLYTQLGYIND